ncbi:MAG: hypothetical protein Q9188_002175 [Gyalolechia gomerana]
MATQDAEKSAIMTKPCATGEKAKHLKEDIDTARGYERLLKANVAALRAGPSVDDIRAKITALELEKEELSDHLEGLRSGRIKPPSQIEKQAVDKAWDDWRRKAESSKRVFMELWAIVQEGLPERRTKEQLWACRARTAVPQSLMTTFLPPQQSPLEPLPLYSTSPPDHFMSNVTQHDHSVRAPNGLVGQFHSSESTVTGNPSYGNTKSSMPVPKAPLAPAANGDTPHRNAIPMAGGMPFNAARSPPNAKSKHSELFQRRVAAYSTPDTSHVPCKFFRLGQCQAGKACPFSHSTDVSSVDTPCKYFAKRIWEFRADAAQGNCKFGSKCALAHILPNGRRVNRPNNIMGGPLNLGGRVDPQTYHPDSALANSLLAQQTHGDQPSFGMQFPHLPDSEYLLPPTNGYEMNGHMDNGLIAHTGSKYGSPRDDGRIPLSPANHLSTLDAPMPASFDSQGISYIARHGPVAASVPSKFGLESPPASLPKKVGVPSNTLRNLHNSVFGQEPRSNASNFGSSPLGSGDEVSGRRPLYSQRVTKPTMISASVPRGRANEDWDDGIMFGGEEDFLPTSLHELLTPQERMRRLSRNEQDERPSRESWSGAGTPADPSSHVGSPSHASPSRFSAFFAKQRRDEQHSQNSSASAFGLIGSPLRHSSMPLGRSASLRATSNPTRSGDASPYVASPPRQSSMSMISQQLGRTRISSKNEAGLGDPVSSNSLHPNSARIQNQSLTGSARLDRASSTNNMPGRRIDEEQGEGVFSMEVEEEDNQKKRSSGSTWNHQQSIETRPDRSQSPKLGPIGTGRTHRAREAEKVAKEYWT